ncbi:hypothetical protein LINGRAHAP2_LOCUS23669 [Linum grandiflorum]
MLIHASFWIHILDLPREFCNRRIVDKLGSTIGHVLTTMICKDIASHKLFIRVRVVINATRPLLTKVSASHKQVPFHASLRYENIPILCFICGLLGHDKAHCPRKLYPYSSTPRYGPELRGRRGWRQVDEITLKPVRVQPLGSLWDSFRRRFNHFKVPAEEANQFTNYINDPVLIHEPFFQQNPDYSIKQELQISTVEAVTFFQSTGTLFPTYKPTSCISWSLFNNLCFDTLPVSLQSLKYMTLSTRPKSFMLGHVVPSIFHHDTSLSCHTLWNFLLKNYYYCITSPIAASEDAAIFQLHCPLRIEEPGSGTMSSLIASQASEKVSDLPIEIVEDTVTTHNLLEE